MIKSILNYLLNRYISPKVRYKRFMTFGDRTIFLPSFKILNGSNNTVNIGEENILGCSILFEDRHSKVEIGNNVYIGNSTIICKSKISFGNNILVAWGVTFYDHNSHSLDYIKRQEDIRQVLKDYSNYNGNFLVNKDWNSVTTGEIVIKDNVWIGFNALILKGVTIGEGAVVAAGAVVSKDVPPFSVVAGNPAQVVKLIEPNNLI